MTTGTGCTYHMVHRTAPHPDLECLERIFFLIDTCADSYIYMPGRVHDFLAHYRNVQPAGRWSVLAEPLRVPPYPMFNTPQISSLLIIMLPRTGVFSALFSRNRGSVNGFLGTSRCQVDSQGFVDILQVRVRQGTFADVEGAAILVLQGGDAALDRQGLSRGGPGPDDPGGFQFGS